MSLILINGFVNDRNVPCNTEEKQRSVDLIWCKKRNFPSR